jgi:glucosamine-6-phosphate deaminase
MLNDDLLRLTTLPVETLRRQARLRFRLLPDRDALLRDMADAILEEVRTHNARQEPTRFILPVGPVSQYRRVIEVSNREGLSWRNVHVFAMDEFLDWQGRPIPQSHPLSFEGHLRREVFARLDPALRIPDGQIVFPHPFRIEEASDRIRAVGGIDCCFGGIGYHGHVAFNDPPLSRWHEISVDELRNSLTRVVPLGDDSIVVQSIHSSGGNSAALPPMAVTLGLRDILASRKIRLYCTAGERHRTVFRISVAGEVSVSFPSTLVQGHPDAEVVTDEATAAPIEVGLR